MPGFRSAKNLVLDARWIDYFWVGSTSEAEVRVLQKPRAEALFEGMIGQPPVQITLRDCKLVWKRVIDHEVFCQTCLVAGTLDP